jgi:mannose-6-phosphate isomerase-like protein (cupin superfamily)
MALVHDADRQQEARHGAPRSRGGDRPTRFAAAGVVAVLALIAGFAAGSVVSGDGASERDTAVAQRDAALVERDAAIAARDAAVISVGRRVVTGHDASGKAVFVSDEEVAPVALDVIPGYEFFRLWGADEPLRFPDGGIMPAQPSYYPPLGGFRFGLFTVPPDIAAGSGDDLDIAALAAELEEKLPGLLPYMEPDEPGMHTTATVDFNVVLSGEVTLELDDGAMLTLGPGDTAVQNGTRHRWLNHGSEPAVLAAITVGAHHDDVG